MCYGFAFRLVRLMKKINASAVIEPEFISGYRKRYALRILHAVILYIS